MQQHDLYTMSDQQLTRTREQLVAEITDYAQRRRARFGRSWAPLDFSDLDELDRTAREHLDLVRAEQDRRHRVKTGNLQAQLTRQHLDEWHDC